MNAGLVLIFTLLINVILIFHLFYCTRYSGDIEIRKSDTNISSLSELEESAGLERHFFITKSSHYLKRNVSEMAFSNIDFKIGRWDNRRLYKMYDFALVGKLFKEAGEKSRVCLATQTSVERMHSIIEIADHWNGPISIAIFIAGTEEFEILQYYVTYLRVCFHRIRSNIAFHIAVPYNMVPQKHINQLKSENFNCQHPQSTLRTLLKSRSQETIRWRLRNVYPQNHMRNLARKGCPSKYVFLTDVDIIPSKKMVEHLNKFLHNTNCRDKCAFVIPTYEIDLRAQFPSSKTELLNLVKKGLARPFHEKVFIYNQFATNFSRWQSNKPSERNEIHISHGVTNFEFLYEPFYVALDIVPVYDERFLGYGFTRNSQVYEMYVAGYYFYVLSPIFTCHWGLQQKHSRSAWREQQNNINRKRFEIFKNEIFSRYQKKHPCGMGENFKII